MVGHETTHVGDYESQVFFGFQGTYFGQYLVNKNAGENDYEAYQGIASETKAFANGDKIDAFFNDAQNKNDFMNIISDKNLTDEKNENRLEALVLERIQLPGLNNLKGSITSTLGKLYNEAGIMGVMDTKKNEKSTTLIKAVETILQMVNTQITDTQNRVNKLKK